jgi:hypothetical protein
MLFGVPGFSYDNSGTKRRSFDQSGLFSANLGDNMQTVAVRHLYAKLKVPADRIVRVDRDTLPGYDGPPVVLPMNGVFPKTSLPVSPKVTPLWIGFHASADTIATHRDWLQGQGLIGCRDPATAERLRAAGCQADVSGCLTFSLAERTTLPDFGSAKVLIITGQGDSAVPPEALKAMPDELLERAEFIMQRRAMTELPLSEAAQDGNERIAAQLLARYRKQALLVVTSLHHAASPCIASGIPTVVIRRAPSDRFGFMETLVPVHTGDFGGIDWTPEPVDLTAVKRAQKQRLQALIAPYLQV